MCCNPGNGRVNFEEWSAYKIQLHDIEWIVSLSADWDQSPTKKKKCLTCNEEEHNGIANDREKNGNDEDWIPDHTDKKVHAVPYIINK
jgi:hypothetical protein